MSTIQLPGLAGPAPSARPAGRRLDWLLLGATFLLLAGGLARGDETASFVEDGATDGFETGRPVRYTLDAPVAARLLPRIRPAAGGAGSYSLTRNFGISSSDSDRPRGVMLDSPARGSFPRLTPQQNSLLAYAAGNVSRHFEKLATWSDGSGAGISYPLSSNVDLFFDSRSAIPNSVRYFGVARVGLRRLF